MSNQLEKQIKKAKAPDLLPALYRLVFFPASGRSFSGRAINLSGR